MDTVVAATVVVSSVTGGSVAGAEVTEPEDEAASGHISVM